MKKAKGYRLHIEGCDTEPTAFRSMAEVKAEQRALAKEYKQAFKEIEKVSYVVTEAEYQESLKS